VTEAWRAEILELIEDLAVVEGALVEIDGDLVDKRQSLRWIERTRARLTELAERMSRNPLPEEEIRS